MDSVVASEAIDPGSTPGTRTRSERCLCPPFGDVFSDAGACLQAIRAAEIVQRRRREIPPHLRYAARNLPIRPNTRSRPSTRNIPVILGPTFVPETASRATAW
jgi:hypothetical protein